MRDRRVSVGTYDTGMCNELTFALLVSKHNEGERGGMLGRRRPSVAVGGGGVGGAQ